MKILYKYISGIYHNAYILFLCEYAGGEINGIFQISSVSKKSESLPQMYNAFIKMHKQERTEL
jgi:hypothetical protein